MFLEKSPYEIATLGFKDRSWGDWIGESLRTKTFRDTSPTIAKFELALLVLLLFTGLVSGLTLNAAALTFLELPVLIVLVFLSAAALLLLSFLSALFLSSFSPNSSFLTYRSYLWASMFSPTLSSSLCFILTISCSSSGISSTSLFNNLMNFLISY